MPVSSAIALSVLFTLQPHAAAQQEGDAPASRSMQLRDALVNLTAEVRALRAEIAKQQENDNVRFNILASKYQLVLLDIQRLKAEEKELMERYLVARGRELDAQNRLANIQQELVILGDINRADAETRLRKAYTQQYAAAHDDIANLQAALRAVREKLERTEAVAEAFRKKLKIHPSQIDEIEREINKIGP